MKILLVKVLVFVLLTFIPYSGVTNAELFDDEVSENKSTASSLDFELQDITGNEISGNFMDENKLISKEVIEKEFRVVNKGQIEFDYWPKFEYKAGNEDVCEEIVLVVKKDDEEVYNGVLSDFDMATSSAQITGIYDKWKFLIEHQSEDVDLQGENCGFEIVFKAYEIATKPEGFSDTEKVIANVGIAYEPNLTLEHFGADHKIRFTLSNLTSFTEFEYSLIYDTDTIQELVSGSETLSGENTKVKEIILGTCSGLSCVYQANPRNFDLNIELIDVDGDSVNLHKNL